MTLYCSEHSQATDTPLYGTASHANIWLLLEHTDPWQAKALKENTLPHAVHQWLGKTTASLADSFGNARALFIRRERQAWSGALYIVRTDPSHPVLYKVTLGRYEDALALDIPAILAGQTHHQPQTTPLIAICTHGKRDRCCAKFGRPIYLALRDEPQLDVWQCSHIGGHRYAATGVAFPSGVYYGYMSPERANAIANGVRDGYTLLSHYRGRSCYTPAVSAADYLVRSALDLPALSDLTFVSAEQPDDTLHHITFARGATQHIATIRQTRSEPELASCNKPGKPRPVFELCELR